MRFVTEEKRCSGCRTCQIFCAMVHFRKNNPKLGMLKIHGHFPEPGAYSISHCTQCGLCAQACPVGAIREKDGVYLVDPEACTKCGVCVDACPYGVIFLHEEIPCAIKCDNCGECIRICPRVALMDGEKEVENYARI